MILDDVNYDFFADDEEMHGLVNSEPDTLEYENVKAHIVFIIRDKPEELVEALKLLSDVSCTKYIAMLLTSLQITPCMACIQILGACSLKLRGIHNNMCMFKDRLDVYPSLGKYSSSRVSLLIIVIIIL